MECTFCGHPHRAAICASKLQFALQDTGNWINLMECPECGALWQCFLYGRTGGFKYLLPWPWHAGFWRSVYDMDDGYTLTVWHEATLRSVWDRLSEVDKRAAEEHKRRDYFNTPFFPVYASEKQWQEHIVRIQPGLEKIYGTNRARVLLERRPTIPDLGKLIRHSR